MSTPCIDIHSHFFPRNAPDFARKFGAGSGPWVTLHDHGDGTGMMMLGDKPFRPVHSALWDTAARLVEMDASHVETQIICATPVMFAYDAPAVEAAYVAASYNDLALEFCAPGGRIARARAGAAAGRRLCLRRADRAMRAGCVGVQIGNHVGPREMDDEGIVRFLAHCAHEGAAVLVHPWDMMGGERLKRWMSAWTVAMPPRRSSASWR